MRTPPISGLPREITEGLALGFGVWKASGRAGSYRREGDARLHERSTMP